MTNERKWNRRMPLARMAAQTVRTVRAVAAVVAASGLLIASPVSATTQAAPVPLAISSPAPGATLCSEADFGAVQIRIGLHATLHSCFRGVALDHAIGTAIVSVPREFESREIGAAEFDAFRADVMRIENAARDAANDSIRATPGRLSVVPLGVFDDGRDRIGYAYAYEVRVRTPAGTETWQTMMRTETFVRVKDRVLLLMVIVPLEDGDAVQQAFAVCEMWAARIVAENADS